MTQPTRGPWAVEDAPRGYDIVAPNTIVVASTWKIESDAEEAANARVIAASWDMWVELQRLYRLYGHPSTEKVLAKVVGKERAS